MLAARNSTANRSLIRFPLIRKQSQRHELSSNIHGSEPVLQSELNLARRRRRCGDLPESGADCDRWNSQIRVIQGIEELRTELQGLALCQAEILGEAEVDGCEPWPAQNSHTRIPECLERDESLLARVRL